MSTFTKTRLTHTLAFVTALGTAVVPAWLDPQQTLPARIALTLVTTLLLLVRTDQLVSQRNAILGGLALAGGLVAGIAGKYTAGTAGAAVIGCVAAVLAQVRVILAGKLAEVATTTKSPPSIPPMAAVLALLAGLGVLG